MSAALFDRPSVSRLALHFSTAVHTTDYHSMRADVWKQTHPEFIRTYRVDERRDAADRRQHRRAERRLAGGSAAVGN